MSGTPFPYTLPNVVSLGPTSPSILTQVIVNTNSSGDNTIVAAATNQYVRVYAMLLVAAGAVTVTVEDGTGGGEVALTGAMSLITGTPLILPYSQFPWFSTSKGNAFNLKLGTGVQLSGAVWYLQG